jgi:hypothetical protein
MYNVGDPIKTLDGNFVGIVAEKLSKFSAGVLKVKIIINDNNRMYDPDNSGFTYLYETDTYFDLLKFESEKEKLAFVLKHL